MGGRARHALTAAALAALASAAAAQNPPAAPPARDTTAPQLIFNDVFAPGEALPAFVTLGEAVVYRIEIQPAAARVNIRVRGRPSLPPLLMVPLSGEAADQETASYLIVPRSSADYQIDVAAAGDEPVRVRIWTDPKEGSRYARIHAEGFRVPILAAAVEAVYLASFRDAYSSSADSVFGYHTAPESAYGIEGCLAVLPNGKLLPDRVGGCAVVAALWHRGSGRSFYTIGIAPEYVVRRRATSALAVSPQLAFGNTTGGKPTAQYTFIGLGVRYTASLGLNAASGYQLEAAIVNVRSLPAALDPRRVSTFTLRIGAGLTLKL